MQSDIHHISNREEIFFIKGRNRHVKRGLKNVHEKRLDGDLKVFCVSNVYYEEGSRQQDSEMDRRLRAISGIPELRKFCYFLSADSRLRDAKNFLWATLPSLITSISMHSKEKESLMQNQRGPLKFDTSAMRGIRDIVRNRFQRRSIHLSADVPWRS